MSKKVSVALCYDFDKTLSPKDMQEYQFIPALGINANDFWMQADKYHQKGMDKILACMYMMIKKGQEYDIPITRKAFMNSGKKVELFPGVETFFDRVNTYGNALGLNVEHYIISSGMKEIIEGTSIAKNFKRIFASEFYYDANNVAKWPAYAVNFSSKTQFLYRINKGALDVTDEASINEFMEESARPVSFKNMLYIGDGFTDIPCMRLVKANGGYSIAVYSPEEKEKESIAKKLLNEGRVSFITPADYTEKSGAETIVFAILEDIASRQRLAGLSK